jgi:hypothetical protein
LLGGLLGVAVVALHPHCLDHLHLPLDLCRHLEVAHLIDLLLHQLEPLLHFELVEMLGGGGRLILCIWRLFGFLRTHIPNGHVP